MVGSIPVPVGSNGVAGRGQTLWILCCGSDPEQGQAELWRVDAASGEVVRRVRIGTNASAIAVGNGSIWLNLFQEASYMQRRDATSLEEIGDFQVPRGWQVIFGEGAVWLQVTAHAGQAGVARVDPETNERQTFIPLPGEPGSVRGITSGQGSIWINASGPAQIDAATGSLLVVPDRPPEAGELAGVCLVAGGLWLSFPEDSAIARYPVR